MSRPQKHFSDLMATLNSPIGPKRAQKDPKRQKFKKSENKKSYKMKVISLYDLTSKTCFRPYINPKKLFGFHPSPKNSPIEPKKAQNYPKNQKIKKWENKKSYKMKVISLYQ